MKKLLSLLLAALLFSLAACTAAPQPTEPLETVTAETTAAEEEPPRKPVPSPTAYPDYAAMIGEDTSVAHLREIAVQAMRDELTVQWYPERSFTYNKTGAVSWKNFRLYRNRTYQGLPYTSAGMGLYQFLEYYDSETGCMSYTDASNFALAVGNSCTSAPAWALFAVSTSAGGGCISNFVTIPNGFYPLGEVTYPEDVADFTFYPTDRIVNENGEEKILGAYALAQPADLVVCDYSGSGHTMMVIEPAHVEYKPDGRIDAAKSYLVIQDQRADEILVSEEKRQMMRSGRVEYKATFAELLASRYLAVTVAEFLGKKPYEATDLRLSNEPETPEDFNGATLSCNRAIAVVRVKLTAQDGTEKQIARHLFTRSDIASGAVFDFKLNKLIDFKNDRRLPKSGSFTLTVTAIAADGVTASFSIPVTR